jgi:hypothetical protein
LIQSLTYQPISPGVLKMLKNNFGDMMDVNGRNNVVFCLSLRIFRAHVAALLRLDGDGQTSVHRLLSGQAF